MDCNYQVTSFPVAKGNQMAIPKIWAAELCLVAEQWTLSPGPSIARNSCKRVLQHKTNGQGAPHQLDPNYEVWPLNPCKGWFLGKGAPLGKGMAARNDPWERAPFAKGWVEHKGCPLRKGKLPSLEKGKQWSSTKDTPWKRDEWSWSLAKDAPWERDTLAHNHCKRIALAKGQLPRLALEKGCPLKKGVCHKQSLRKDVPCKREIAKINPWERMLLNAKGNPLQKGTATLALELFGHPLGKGKVPALILAKG